MGTLERCHGERRHFHGHTHVVWAWPASQNKLERSPLLILNAAKILQQQHLLKVSSLAVVCMNRLLVCMNGGGGGGGGGGGTGGTKKWHQHLQVILTIQT